MEEEQMNIEKQLRKLAYISLLIMAIVATVINCIQYQKVLQNEKMTRLYLISKPYVNKVQTAVKYGKSIEELYGMEHLLVQNKEQDQEIIDVVIALNSGIRFIATSKALKGTSMVDNLNVDNKWRSKQRTLTRDGDNYVLTIPILKANERAGYYEVILSGHTINRKIIDFILLSLISALFSLVVGGILLRILFQRTKGETKKRIVAKVIGVLLLSLMMIQLPNLIMIEKAYKTSTEQISLDLAKTMYEQIEGVIESKNLSYSELNSQYNLQGWLENYVQEVSRVAAVYTASDNMAVKEGTYYWPQTDGAAFYIGIVCTDNYISNKQLKSLIYSIVLILIMLITLKVWMKYVIQTAQARKLEKDSSILQKAINGNIEKVSLLSFIISGICYLPVLFLPMVTTAMSRGQEIVICSMAIGCFVAGQLVAEHLIRPLLRMIKWRYLLGLGSMILCMSLWISASVSDLYYFILWRFTAGVAYGMIQAAIRGSLLHEVDYKKKKEIYESIGENNKLGILGGLITGGVLYDVLDKQGVYFVSTALVILFYLMQRMFIRDVPLALKRGYEEKQRRSIKKRLLHLFFILFIVVPTSFYSMIFCYYIPIYIQYQHEITATFKDLIVISIVFCIGSFWLMPKLYSRLRKKFSVYLLSSLLAAITGFSLILFTEALKENPQSLIPLVVMAATIGIFDGMNACVQREQFTLEVQGEETDPTRPMQQYDDIRLVGCMVAPTLLSLGFSESVFTYIDMTSIVGTIGVVSLGLLIVYVVISVWKSDQYYYFTKGKEERS